MDLTNFTIDIANVLTVAGVVLTAMAGIWGAKAAIGLLGWSSRRPG